MVSSVGPKDFDISLKFGGGIKSRASEDDIAVNECADGVNFDLDLENREFKNRQPFDLVDTATNAAQINGFAQLIKQDGTTSTLVQAGTTVYEWDGAGTFTSRGTVASGVAIRGRMTHNFTLDEKVLISDLNMIQPVMEWDGTTLANITHNLTGAFIAKYIFVESERANYGHVSSNGVLTPHMLVGSKQGDYDNLSTTAKPSSALAVDDPFFMLTPDLKPINGLISAFGKVVMSSANGSMFFITGVNSKDFAITSLYPNSAADGDEAMAYIGNDVAYGRQGRVESLLSTATFGDVETDDVTRSISNKVSSFNGWTTVFNSRVQRVYFFPSGQSEIWVLHKPILDDEAKKRNNTILSKDTIPAISPWSKWTTAHALAFQPTAVMNFLDPVDGLEYVFMGDASGNIYRLEGSGVAGDGGTTSVASERLSKLFTVPLDTQAYEIQGWIKYRRNTQGAVTVTLTLEYAGNNVFDQALTITIPALSAGSHYGAANYYGGDDVHYGTKFSDRLVRQPLDVAGMSNEFQIRVTVDSKFDFQINEVGLRFLAST